MATREQGSILGERVPLPMEDAKSMSWALGSELAARKPECARLEHDDSAWSLTVFEATPHTVLARVRTAVGREKFYGLATADLKRAFDSLPSSWHIAHTEC